MSSDFLGKEKITPLLIKLSLPATIGMLVAALYNVVDTIFVGQGVGAEAIGGLAIAFPIQMLLVSVAQAVGIGAASIISRKLGEKKPGIARITAGTAFCSVIIFAFAIMLILYIFMDSLLLIFGSTETLLPYVHEYLFYIGMGFVPCLFSMTAGCLIRAEGKVHAVMCGMIFGTVLNIALDPIFIFALDMGIKGAAIATIISQFCSACYFANFYLTKKSVLNLKFRDIKINYKIFTETVLLGLPNFLRMTGMSLLVIIANRTLGYYGGDEAISSYGMINRLFSLVILPVIGINQGFQPIAGYNYGAKNYDRLKEVLVKGILLACVTATAGFFLMMLLPEQLMSMFTSDQNLLMTSAGALQIMVLFIPIVGIQMISATYFQAVGKKVQALILSLMRQVIILVPLIIILPKYWGVNGVWFSFPIADLSSTIISVFVLLMEIRHLELKENTKLY